LHRHIVLFIMKFPGSLWNREGRVPAKVNLVWERLSFSKITFAYFLFSLFHCIIQVAFQSHAFVVNKRGSDGLASIVEKQNATRNGFLVLRDDLRLCNKVPDSFNTDHCDLVWTTSSVLVPTPSATSSGFSNTATPSAPSTNAQPPNAAPTGNNNPLSSANSNIADANESGEDSDTYGKQDSSEETVTVTIGTLKARQSVSDDAESQDNEAAERVCLTALNYPVMVLRNTKREDAAFIAFQIWVLGMSMVALLNESVPHILASFFTHLAATAWAGFQLYSTQTFHSQFDLLITDGTCRSTDLVPSYWGTGYWRDRRNSEIPILAFNVVALALSAFMTWKLLKSFGWQTFKRVGASRSMNRIYRTVLTLSITIQLSLFFMAVTLATWIDQLSNGEIGKLADMKTFYEILFILTLITLLPWLITGWIAARRESRAPMLVFLLLSIWFFAGFGGMFLATSFRWTFMTWSFFGVVSSLSVILTLASFILGLVCWYNFGRGLRQHLVVEEPLAGADFVPVYPAVKGDIEKIGFPGERPLPTYSAAFDTRV
jgi:hypothetical protein